MVDETSLVYQMYNVHLILTDGGSLLITSIKEVDQIA